MSLDHADGDADDDADDGGGIGAGKIDKGVGIIYSQLIKKNMNKEKNSHFCHLFLQTFLLD